MRKVLRTPDAAEYIGLSVSTLERMRQEGTGPTFIRLGVRAVGYDLTELDAWLDSLRRASPAEAPTGR